MGFALDKIFCLETVLRSDPLRHTSNYDFHFSKPLGAFMNFHIASICKDFTSVVSKMSAPMCLILSGAID